MSEPTASYRLTVRDDRTGRQVCTQKCHNTTREHLTERLKTYLPYVAGVRELPVDRLRGEIEPLAATRTDGTPATMAALLGAR